MKRIEMDFNAVRADGRFKVWEGAASEPLVVGDKVVCFDSSEESLEFPGVVDEVNSEGFYLVTVNWGY